MRGFHPLERIAQVGARRFHQVLRDDRGAAALTLEAVHENRVGRVAQRAPDEGVGALEMDAEVLLRDVLGGQSMVLEGPDVRILEIVGAVQHVRHAESLQRVRRVSRESAAEEQPIANLARAPRLARLDDPGAPVNQVREPDPELVAIDDVAPGAAVEEAGVHVRVEAPPRGPLAASNLELRFVVPHDVLPVDQPLAHSLRTLRLLLRLAKLHGTLPGEGRGRGVGGRGRLRIWRLYPAADEFIDVSEPGVVLGASREARRRVGLLDIAGRRPRERLRDHRASADAREV